MNFQALRVPEWVWLIVVVGLIVATLEGIRGCAPSVVIRERIIRVPVQLPPLTGTTQAPVVVRYVRLAGRMAVDTLAVARLRDSIDLLTERLERHGARLTWGIDTVTAERDTVRITCTAPGGLTWDVRHGARIVEHVVRDTIAVARERSRIGLGIGAGATMGADAVLRPGVFVGITYTLLP